jgi:hypothetical protein
MDALKSLLGDAKGLFGVALMIAMTTLVVVGKMTTAEWKETAVWLYGIYAGSQAVHAGLANFGSGGSSTPAPATAKAEAQAAKAPEVVK